jgi:hypothetical protein
MVRITREQLQEWQVTLAWNEGASLDAGTVERLLREIERLQGELEQLRSGSRAAAPSLVPTSH